MLSDYLLPYMARILPGLVLGIASLVALRKQAPSVLVVALLGNLYEEVLFRGYLQGYLQTGCDMGRYRAGVTSGLLFSTFSLFQRPHLLSAATASLEASGSRQADRASCSLPGTRGSWCWPEPRRSCGRRLR